MDEKEARVQAAQRERERQVQRELGPQQPPQMKDLYNDHLKHLERKRTDMFRLVGEHKFIIYIVVIVFN